MHRYAIVFHTENKHNSAYEKLAVILATSIREHMPNVDAYCGCFTENTLSSPIRESLLKLDIKLNEHPIFKGDQGDTSFYLRLYTKYFYSKLILDSYDYLVYIDVDTLFLKPLKFDFDPTGPIALVEKIPEWVKKDEAQRTTVPSGNLYYNWIEVINQHNKFLFDIDFTDLSILKDKLADGFLSKKIDESGLQLIDQKVGAYHCLKPLTKDTQVIHYDELDYDGSFINLEEMYPVVYKKYKLLIENVLGLEITNQKNYWENIRAKNS